MTKIAHFLLIFLLALSSCTASSMSKRGGLRLCGTRLVETLNLVCSGEFYGPSIQARNIDEETLGDAYISRILGLPASKSNGYLRLGRRQLMGVADECCRKTCSFQVLASYCGK